MKPRCSSCNAEIWWAVTPAGKRMPVDVQPVEGGNVVMDREKIGRERALGALAGVGEDTKPADVAPLVRILKKGEEVDWSVPRYVSHFATCPKSHRHRRPARGAA